MADQPVDIFDRLLRTDGGQSNVEERERLIDELKERSSKAKIEIQLNETSGGATYLQLLLPQARQTRSIFLYGNDDFKRLLRVPFEKYRFLEGFSAICNYEEGTVEGGVRIARQGITAPVARILARIIPESSEEATHEISLESEDASKPHIRLGPPSPEYKAMLTRRNSQFTLKLRSADISTHDHARNILEKYANSLFFQMDCLYGVPLTLTRERSRPFRRPIKSQLSGTDLIQYPITQYDDAPSSLYWYGRSADGMPLLQFLAFYQVVEYFFPIYSQAEAQRRIRLVLKDPTFRADKDTDIGRIVSTIQSTRSGGFFDEKTQLRATIKECVSPDQLREFISEDDSRLRFYKEDYKSVHTKRISVSSPDADLRDEVAERLYGIRCKIVHTKHSDIGDSEVELLLPYSREEENIGYDIELMAFVARSAIIASGSSL